MMQFSKRFLLPTLVLVVSIFAFGCQFESGQEPTPTDATQQEVEMQKTESQTQDEIRTVPIDEITQLTWMWSELTENKPAAKTMVPDPENYTLTFWENGDFSFKADCNNGGSSYTVEGDKIEFGPMMSTMAMCPSKSLHDAYLAALGEIDTFGMAGEELVLTLKANTGEMRLVNDGPAEQAEIPTDAPETPAAVEKTLYIGPEKAECVGVGPMECYLVKEEPDGEWQYFYDPIEGFEWEPDYTYELRVAVYPVENPPADASSLRYELIQVVDKVETLVEPEGAEVYISIEKPINGAEVDVSKPIIVSGMGAGLFEGNVVVQILDAEGVELALQPTIIQSPDAGIGGEGPWETEINLSIVVPTIGKIVAFAPSPKDGEGWMANDEVTVTLNPEMTLEPSLENTPWILRSFAQQEELDSLLTVYQVTAIFSSEDGRLNGIAGCNNYFTSYTLDGNQLSLSTPLGTTRMMCPEPQMVLENAYLAALEEVTSYELTGDVMEIYDAAGNPLLLFQVDPYSLSQSFTHLELANTSYLNEFANAGIVQLVDGLHREPVAEDSATELVVMLTNHAAFGDAAGDGSEDAVVVLVSQPGGSGSFYDLAVVRKQDDALTNLALIQLGDRVQIKRLDIKNGEIIVDMLTQGPDDPMCCPTQYIRYQYTLESGELVLTRSEIIE